MTWSRMSIKAAFKGEMGNGEATSVFPMEHEMAFENVY